MNQESVIADIEHRARSVGVTIDKLCRRANVHPTTFSRWKASAKNPDPIGATLQAIGRLYDALDAIEVERSTHRLSGDGKKTVAGRSAAA